MKYRLFIVFTLIMVLLAVVGCGKNAEISKQLSAEGSDQKTSEQSNSETPNIPDLSGMLMKDGWPADKVPSELMEYTEGKVKNSGGEDDDYIIDVEETNEEAFANYIDKLKSSGWIISGSGEESEAIMGLYTVNFNWMDSSSTWLRINVQKDKEGEWSFDKIPPDILQPEKGTLVGGTYVLEQTEGVWYFNYTYDGIDEKAAKEYMQFLIENGWSGDDTFVSKSFEWKGKTYGADIEVYETLETRTTFTCNFYLGG